MKSKIFTYVALLSSFISVQGFAVELPLSQILSASPTLPVPAVQHALSYYKKAKTRLGNPQFLTVIDYTASSRTKRMHVIDLITGEVDRYLVAHGRNSGEDYAKYFSNVPESFKSSTGMYLTLEPYFGKHGLSLELRGLDPTNSKAEERDIVLHGADYVSDAIAKTASRLGRSLGCPAVDLKYSELLVNQLKRGSLIYVYGGQ